MQYRKKPVVIDAVEYTGSFDELAKFAGESVSYGRNGPEIKTLEGTMIVSMGDFVIKGIAGEIYPCKPDIFHGSYEKV